MYFIVVLSFVFAACAAATKLSGAQLDFARKVHAQVQKASTASAITNQKSLQATGTSYGSGGSWVTYEYNTAISTTCASTAEYQAVGLINDVCIALSATESLKIYNCTVGDTTTNPAYFAATWTTADCTGTKSGPVTVSVQNCGSGGTMGYQCVNYATGASAPNQDKYGNNYPTADCTGQSFSWVAFQDSALPAGGESCSGKGCIAVPLDGYTTASVDVNCGAFETLSLNVVLSIVLVASTLLFM